MIVGVALTWAGVRLLAGNGGDAGAPPPRRFVVSGALFVFVGVVTAVVAGRTFTNVWVTMERGVFPLSALSLDARPQPIHTLMPARRGQA